MKKIISILSVLFVLAAGTCFAESDIQVGMGIYAYSRPLDNNITFNVNAHQFFGETQTFGIAEVLNIHNWGANLFIGPAFGFNLVESLRLQIATGLKWGVSAYNGTKEGFFGDSNDLFWGNDVQLKMTSNRLCSFLIGIQFSTGITLVDHPYDTSSASNAWALDIAPYVGVSFNFKDRD